MKKPSLPLKIFYFRYLIFFVFAFLLTMFAWKYYKNWGLKGRYYSNTQWHGKPVITQKDPTPYLKGETGHDLTSTESYSVKWSGWIMIEQTGTYRFATNSDDGSYLSLDNRLIIDNGGMHGLQRLSTEIFLEQGIYPIEVLYLQAGGYSVIQTRWAPPNKIETQIPAEVLFQTRPSFVEIFVRKCIVTVYHLPKAIWFALIIGIGIIGVLLFWQYQQMLISWESWHTILLICSGFFLLATLLLRYGSTYVLIDGRDVSYFEAQASNNHEDAQFAIDRWIDTAWTTDAPMQPNMFFQINLGQALNIGKLLLSNGKFEKNYPRGYRIEVSLDGQHWKEIHVIESHFRNSESLELFFSPITFQYIKIFQTEYNHAPWTIQEVYLYSPSWIPRSYQFSLYLVFFLGGGTTILSLIFSLCPQIRSCRKIVFIGLAIIIIIGFAFRIFMIRYHDLDTDEKQYLFEAFAYFDSDAEWAMRVLNTDHRRTAILYLYLTRWLFKICHVSSLAIRSMSVILGTLTIFLTFYAWYNISKHEKCVEALIASAFMATNILHVTWSRDGHSQVQMTFFYILYLYFITKVITTESAHLASVYSAGIVLFIGFFFHGSMLVAPVGVFIFMMFDAIMTHRHLSKWQPFILKNYLFIILSSLPFGAYVYYVLNIKGGLNDAENWAKTSINQNPEIIVHLLDFLSTRWNLLLTNLSDFDLFNDYDFSNWVYFPIWALVLIGIFHVLYKRQKSEWFIVIQPGLFILIISSLWSTSHFERFFLPILLSISICASRGIIVVSMIFKKPVLMRLFRFFISLLVISSLSANTVYRIFIEQPPYIVSGSWIYKVYSGKYTTFMYWVRYIKQSPRYAESIVMCDDPWIAHHYKNMFTIPINFLDTVTFKKLIASKHNVPVFIILASSPDKDLANAIQQHYNAIEPTSFYWRLYELRNEKNVNY